MVMVLVANRLAMGPPNGLACWFNCHTRNAGIPSNALQQKVNLNRQGWLYSAFFLYHPLLGGIGGLNVMLILVAGSWILNEIVFSGSNWRNCILWLVLFGLFWVGWAFHTLHWLRIPPWGIESSLIVVIVSRIVLLFWWTQIWKTPLAPGISPKKTREGAYVGQ